MTARSKAVEDIKEELKSESKVFLVFNVNLNPVINALVKEYLKQQENMSKK